MKNVSFFVIYGLQAPYVCYRVYSIFLVYTSYIYIYISFLYISIYIYIIYCTSLSITSSQSILPAGRMFAGFDARPWLQG